MRIFIAIPLSPDLIGILTHTQQRLLGAVPQGLAPANLSHAHLTLLFIGETPESELSRFKGALTQLGAAFQQCTLELTHLGAFPKTQDPIVVWAGARDPSGTLARLARELGKIAQELGHTIETREFIPHLTLARNKQVRNRTALRLFIEREKLPRYIEIVSRVVLYQSIPTPEGHRYEELASVTLGSP